MTHEQKKRQACHATDKPTSTNHACNCSPCRCGKQLHFAGFTPPPERGEGPVELYLRTRPGWHDRGVVAIALSLTEREVRAQAENSGGLVIFGSGRGQGLKHSNHADTWEARQCAAELRARAASHLRRAMEIEQAMQEMGVRT
jgi:hypothetical protein